MNHTHGAHHQQPQPQQTHSYHLHQHQTYSHPPPPATINLNTVVPQSHGPLAAVTVQQQQTHAIPSISTHYGGIQKPYVNPMIRDQRMKQGQPSQHKNRQPNAQNGLLILSVPPNQQHVSSHQQQTHNQFQNPPPTHYQKKPFKQNQNSNLAKQNVHYQGKTATATLQPQQKPPTQYIKQQYHLLQRSQQLEEPLQQQPSIPVPAPQQQSRTAYIPQPSTSPPKVDMRSPSQPQPTQIKILTNTARESQVTANNLQPLSVSTLSAAPEPKNQESGGNIQILKASANDNLSPNANEKLSICLPTDNMANIKEKTPMCLVNELARYNKIQHQYRLTGEQGPAHSKRFTVTLRLGEEEYTADGASIKKAQHSAAGDAVGKTKYKHPPAKSSRVKSNGKAGVGTITPTVELNALAMKLGEPTVYVLESSQGGHGVPEVQNVIPNSSHQQNIVVPVSNAEYYHEGRFRNFSNFKRNNVYSSPRTKTRSLTPTVYNKTNVHSAAQPGGPKDPCKITLVVGSRKFLGIGPTLQSARHDAAARALDVLKPLVVIEESHETSVQDEDISSDLKSPISLVHEVALKRSFTVSFEVQSEKGPPHMKTFITSCRVGTITTQGEGNGKKISKKRAAEKMLDELKKLPPLSPQSPQEAAVTVAPSGKMRNVKRGKIQPIKKKTRNLIKEKSEPEYPEDVNPISRLIQIQQAAKEREPVYTVVEERGAPRRREFIIEVSAGRKSARGMGPNKKQAKRIAAENLLILMGYSVSGPANKENQPKPGTDHNGLETQRKMVFQEVLNENAGTVNTVVNQGGTSGRQIVPGVLVVQHQKIKRQQSHQNTTQGHCTERTEIRIDKQENLNVSTQSTQSTSTDGARPKDQLLYLAKLLGFQVQFSDYPKGNHGEYLTIVTLSTDPPQICHGAGCNTEASQDQASKHALSILSELGLDNVKPIKPTTS